MRDASRSRGNFGIVPAAKTRRLDRIATHASRVSGCLVSELELLVEGEKISEDAESAGERKRNAQSCDMHVHTH